MACPNRAAAAALGCDIERAADTAAEHAWRVDEAEFRLRAAGSLPRRSAAPRPTLSSGRPLAFYRSVGATHFVREGEALLGATAYRGGGVRCPGEGP